MRIELDSPQGWDNKLRIVLYDNNNKIVMSRKATINDILLYKLNEKLQILNDKIGKRPVTFGGVPIVSVLKKN